jgi:TetR/AcrR family transcriptional repressor of bet genes
MSRANVKDKRKGQLIAAALDSIAKRGLLETTITHISKGAGMSRGIINFYFTSKEMMMREALKTLIDEYESAWRVALSTANDDGRARLNALIFAHFNKELCSAKRLNMMSAFWGHAATQSAYRNQLEAADLAIETAFTECLAQVLNSTLEEAKDASSQLHALIRGLWLTFMLNPKTEAREHLARLCFSFIDRLTGAPVRIVHDVGTQSAERRAPAKAPRKPKPKEKAPVQLDIEDLFAVRG